jgi:SAM-dependent methyltransferase
MTSEELAASSCPSTPDISLQQVENAWEGTVQLAPSAISMLRHINTEEEHPLETVLEVPEEAVTEMREIVESPRFALQLRTDDRTLEPSSAGDADDELSALSVPSPGGFFSSLDASLGRRTWSGAEIVPNTSTAAEFYGVPFKSPQPSLPTSTATSFYNVPWANRPERPVEHIVALASPASERQDPVTARRDAFSPITEAITEVEEIDETYQDTLKQTASANINRTQLWLCTQKAYIDNLCSDDEVIESFKHLEGAVPRTPDRPSPSSNTSSPQSKKSVRFVEANNASDEKVKKRISPIHDGTFWAGFKHTKRSQRARDVFQHRQMRAEAEHVRRNSAGKQHAEQLMGKFELTDAIRPTPARPISSFLPPTIDDDEEKEIFARAERERQALQQLQPSAWHTAATKELHGGSLLTSPIVASFKHRSDVRILDLAGQAHCSWAWDVAVTHPQAQVYTTVSSDAEAHVLSSALEGPMNHSVVAAPRTWVLPFPPNHFDVVSARNLYANLRTLVPNGEVIDEWDLTLQECLRVLKPGGYLEFDLLDAELAHPDAATQALGVEFAFKLRTRGYDPASGKTFLPRLKRAGFHDIKRAWMLLPVADVSPTWTDSGKSSASSTSTVTATAAHGDYFVESERSIGDNGAVVTYEPPVTGSTKDVRAITGLVGARQWEQWILKLAGEMGREEEECLESVGRALESAGRAGEGAGWRCLVGWARK